MEVSGVYQLAIPFDDAGHGAAHGDAEALRQPPQELTGDQAELADRTGETGLRAHSLHHNP